MFDVKDIVSVVGLLKRYKWEKVGNRTIQKCKHMTVD